jgi:hypothetical protein
MAKDRPGDEAEAQWLNPLVIRREFAIGFPKADVRIRPLLTHIGHLRESGMRHQNAVSVSMAEPGAELVKNANLQFRCSTL